MGPNVYTKYDEDLCCPVCKHPLSNPGNPPKPKLPKLGTKGKFRPPQQQPPHNPHSYSHSHSHKEKGHPKGSGSAKEQDDVVVAQCGHLFHKFCLRHYCYLFREGRSNHFTRATCPTCRHSISMSSAQTILYREHQDHITDADKEGTKITLMNNELKDQMKNAKDKLAAVSKSRGEANQNLEIYRSHLKKLKKEIKQVKTKKADVESLYADIQRTDKILAIMQTQHLKIVRKYIGKVKQKDPKDFIHFPRRLAPYLEIIEKDERLVRDLGEVIMPIHLNHLKSDRQSLLKGIIDSVNEKLAEMREKNNEEPDPKSNKGELVKAKALGKTVASGKTKRPPIFVKVRKSSVSILSTTSLTRESIQKIIETVQAQAPIGALNNGMLKPKSDFSNSRVDKVSASDIKIIYMPKRKMVEPVSEPCRAIDPSDSMFIKVPPRRCRSTDAVLMKQRRKRKKDLAKGMSGKDTKEVQVSAKRSKSTSAIPIAEVGGETETATVEVKDKNRCTKKPSALIAIMSLPDDVQATDEVNVESDVNDNKLESDSARNPSATKVKSLKKVRERISVLEMIYNDLKVEGANLDLEGMKPEPQKMTDENNNEIFLGKIHSKNSTNEESSRPPPQFFRVDKKGNVRPESPYRMCFRQPTFLSSVTDMLSDRSSSSTTFMSGCVEPDVENQLNALSPEDRYLLAVEQEAIASGSGVKKHAMFGLPACLGIPPDVSSTSNEVTANSSVPVYLRRWQEQLPSQKFCKMDSKMDVLTHVAQCRSARVDQKRGFMGQSRTRPRIGLHQRGIPHKSGKPSESVHLPPLHMFPAKRPSTADCMRGGDGVEVRGSNMSMFERRRLIEPLPKIYNFSSNDTSFSEINGKM